MEYRRLGSSGLKVPALTFGAGTLGGKGEFFQAWGETDAAGARRIVDICLDAGVTMFDSADVYSSGESERVLGEGIKGRRDKVLISTKATFRAGEGPNERECSTPCRCGEHRIRCLRKQGGSRKGAVKPSPNRAVTKLVARGMNRRAQGQRCS